MILLPLALAAELPDVGPYDRYRVDVPDWPGAEATSAYGSVLLEPPPAGTPYRVEEAPVVDTFVPEEGFAALDLAAWHEAGIDGSGISIAVFDVQWFNAALNDAELGEYTTHDCQAHPSCEVPMDTLRPRYSFEEGSHGVACAEVVRDIAPGVDLHLVRVNGGTTLETAGQWAADNGVDLASMSMSFFNNSFYDGTGAVSGAGARMAQNGSLLVSSAGNYASEHWDGTFDDPDHDGDLDFEWGSSYLPMWLSAPAATVLMSWDEFATCGDTDLDGWMYRQDGVVVGRGEGRQAPYADSCSPVERIRVTVDESGWFYLRILNVAGDAQARVSVYARDGEVYLPTPGSIVDPGSNPSVFTVGAVRAVGYMENAAESFSSLGPTHAGADKPDIAGPDGLSTSVYGELGFYGTSASTPAIAAFIALVMQRDGVDAPTAARTIQANAVSGRATYEPWDGALGAGKARAWDEDVGRICGGGAAWAFSPALLWWLRARRGRKKA